MSPSFSVCHFHISGNSSDSLLGGDIPSMAFDLHNRISNNYKSNLIMSPLALNLLFYE